MRARRGKRQPVGAGSKVRPELAERQGRCGPEGGGNRFGGGENGGDTRSEEADKTRRISGSKTWPPASPHYDWGRGGEGKDRAHAELPSHLPPPGWAPAGTPRPVPPSWPRLLPAPFRVTRRAHAQPGVYGSHRGPQRSGAAEPPPVEHAQYLRLLHVGPRRAEPAVAVTWGRASAAAGSPSRPRSAWKKPPSLPLGLPPSAPDT